MLLAFTELGWSAGGREVAPDSFRVFSSSIMSGSSPEFLGETPLGGHNGFAADTGFGDNLRHLRNELQLFSLNLPQSSQGDRMVGFVLMARTDQPMLLFSVGAVATRGAPLIFDDLNHLEVSFMARAMPGAGSSDAPPHSKYVINAAAFLEDHPWEPALRSDFPRFWPGPHCIPCVPGAFFDRFDRLAVLPLNPPPDAWLAYARHRWSTATLPPPSPLVLPPVEPQIILRPSSHLRRPGPTPTAFDLPPPPAKRPHLVPRVLRASAYYTEEALDFYNRNNVQAWPSSSLAAWFRFSLFRTFTGPGH